VFPSLFVHGGTPEIIFHILKNSLPMKTKTKTKGIIICRQITTVLALDGQKNP
jgi:hypothetical protein